MCKQTNGTILYHFIDEKVNKLLLKQKEFIWDHVMQEKKNDSTNKYWDKIVNFEQYQSDKYGGLRQNLIDNGIKPDLSYNELLLTLASVHDGSNFDAFSFYSNNIYLTKCLLFAHSINTRFQNDLNEVFTNKLAKLEKIQCKFAKAPVKKYERCIIKSQTDYRTQDFPRSASIADFLRCSVTFKNVEDLYNALIRVMSLVKNGECGCVIDILRIKNGFNNILKWDNVNDSGYVDVKINVLIQDIKSKQTMIGEIQLLLSWLLIAKKKGHKLYGIKRKDNFIFDSCNKIYDIDGDYEKYKSKMCVLIGKNDYKSCGIELLLQPNLVLSLVTKDWVAEGPIMQECGKLYNRNTNTKLFDIFLSTLYYYNKTYFSESNRNILKQVLNFNQCRKIFKSTDFWRMTVYDMKHSKSRKSKWFKCIFTSDEFDGIGEMEDLYTKLSFGFWCDLNGFDWLKLVVESVGKKAKHDIVIGNGINHKNSSRKGGYPLISLLMKSHCDVEWLNLFFLACKVSNKQVDQERMERAIEMCGEKELNKPQWKSIIEQYMNQWYPNHA